MGFSIGSLLGGLAPIVGGIFGGPVGAAIGGVVGGAISPSVGPTLTASQRAGETPAARANRLQVQQQNAIGILPLTGPDAFGVTRRRVGTAQAFSRVPGIVGRMSVIGELLQISRQATGQVVTRQKITDAVKHCGIAMASSIFALSESEICQIVISKRRRRGRGISAVDLRRTRSTIRKVHNIQHDLKRLSPAVRRHHK